MITSIRSIIQDHYGTYRNEVTEKPERQWVRIAAQLALSLISAIFIQSFSDDSISVTVTSISILTGFAFTSMMPLIAESRSGLPRARFSEDTDDIKRLGTLSDYFRKNLSYFLAVTIFTIIALIIQMLNPEVPNWLKSLSASIDFFNTLSPAVVDRSLGAVVVFISIFCVAEVFYTFYRMSFTATSILRIKVEYLDGHSAREMDR